MTVDVEDLADILHSSRHGVDFVRLECGVVVQIAADWHGWLQCGGRERDTFPIAAVPSKASDGRY